MNNKNNIERRRYILYYISCITDLAEVVSVTPAAPMPGPPKKTDDKSFFDVSIYCVFNKKACVLQLYKYHIVTIN